MQKLSQVLIFRRLNENVSGEALLLGDGGGESFAFCLQPLQAAVAGVRRDGGGKGEAAFNDEEVAALERFLEPEAVGAQRWTHGRWPSNAPRTSSSPSSAC